MSTNRDAWTYWYPGKEGTVDEVMPVLEKTFRASNVSRILDLGCGTGRHTIYFAEKGFDVYGFDFSSYAVQRCIERLKERNLLVHVVMWDMANRFPYEDEFFDAIVAVRVIHHARFKVIRHVVSEVSRVARKGGYFYAQVPTAQKEFWSKGTCVEHRTRVPLEGPEKGIPHHGFTEQELLKLLSQFGFRVEKITESEAHFNVLAVKI